MDQQFNKTYLARIVSKCLKGKQLLFVEVDPHESREGQDLGKCAASLTVDLTFAGRQECGWSFKRTQPLLVKSSSFRVLSGKIIWIVQCKADFCLLLLLSRLRACAHCRMKS